MQIFTLYLFLLDFLEIADFNFVRIGFLLFLIMFEPLSPWGNPSQEFWFALVLRFLFCLFKEVSAVKIFDILGSEYFKALTGKYQNIFIDCLEIIYNSYRTELSYGIDREILVAQMCDYFERNSSDDIQFEEGQDVFHDSRSKASEFLRKLKGYGWIEYEFDNNCDTCF